MSQVVVCNRIKIDPENRKGRKFSKEKAAEIAESKKAVGLLQPIGVVPITGDPDHDYKLIYGEHRHYAVHKILKEDAIEANVYPDFDDQDQEMARLAENLWRNPLSKIEFLASVGRWYKLYETKYPEKVGKGKAGAAATRKSAAKKKDAKAKAEPETTEAVDPEKANDNLSVAFDGSPAPVVSEPETTGAEPVVPSFGALVAGMTGQSQRSGERLAKIAKSFTDEQFAVMEAKKVTQADMLRISAVEDETARAKVVNLVASGVDVDTALNYGDKPAPAEGEDPKKAEVAMDDAEWLSSICGEIRGRLANTDAFDTSALLYRHTNEARKAFKQKAYPKLAKAKATGNGGPWTRLLGFVLTVSHPRDWLVCSSCSGTGLSGETPCRKCLGEGFKPNFE